MAMYKPKTPSVNATKLRRWANDTQRSASEDRQLALETKKLFEAMLEENSNDDVAKKGITDCLKLMQTAHTANIKIIELLIKFEDIEFKREMSKSIKGSESNTGISLFNLTED